MNIVISQPMFFPWLGMLEQIRLADIYVNYDDVQFSKGSFTNRVQIKTAYGIKWLSVPLQQFKLGTTINKVQLYMKHNWKELHLRQLRQAYASAKYCKDMLSLVEDVYEKEYQTIGQLAHHSTLTCCSYYGLNKYTRFLDVADLQTRGASSERVLNIVSSLSGSSYITGLGAKNYLNHALFDESNISVKYMNYRRLPYPQLHGDFTPYVSVLDLIANTGPNGINYICSDAIYWKEFFGEDGRAKVS